MRLLLENNLYTPYLLGGAERSVQYLAEGLRDLGHEIHVLSLAGDASETDIDGIRVHRTRIRNVYWPFKGKRDFLKPLWHVIDRYNQLARKDVAAVINKVRPDVFHTNNLAGLSVSAWDAASQFGIPILHTLRDYYLLCPSSTMFRDGRNCSTPCRTCSFWADRRVAATGIVSGVVGNSRRILDIHLRNGAFCNASLREVVYSAFPNAQLSSVESKIAKVEDRLIVGYLGQILPSKGVAELVRAVAACRKPVALLVGGEGPEAFMRELQGLAGPETTFLGRTTPAQFFPRINVLAVPSLWEEPLPRVAIESLSFGIPVISSDRGGTPEIIKEGENGWILRAESIEEALTALIERADPCELANMHDACRGTTTQFDSDFVAKRYEELFRRVEESKLMLR